MRLLCAHVCIGHSGSACVAQSQSHSEGEGGGGVGMGVRVRDKVRVRMRARKRVKGRGTARTRVGVRMRCVDIPSNIGVRKSPGAMVHTRTPTADRSRANGKVMAATAPGG